MKGKKGFQKGNTIGRGNRGRIRGPITEKHREALRNNAIKRKKELGYMISPETRKKMLKTRLESGYTHSEETRNKIRLANIGKKGTPMSEENKKKLSLDRKGKKRSREICLKISVAKKGKKNPKMSERLRGKYGENARNWKGGKTEENKIFRGRIEYRLWRESVFARDNWTCQKTGERSKLNVHHIQNFADFPELRFAIDNGITLSEESHIEFHKLFGKRNNNTEQMNEFLIKK